ncbi:MAG: GTP-binding protein [Oscillospiraceae bacterium]|nr:GTP-binding protein [Oscillospiraceae bacterium]
MINIDIISGFLGAGKTTFANMLLRCYISSGLRPVYIVNEFGQTGLDAQIIRADGFDAVEIEGGCICCTLKDDIAAAITEVIDAFSPTNIVFEPSGIFIFDNFSEILKQPGIREKCRLGNVITVVDSVNFSLSKATYGSFIYNQIKNAGIILLSKLEKTKYNTEELICDIKNINPDVFIISKIWSEWDNDDFAVLQGPKTVPRMEHHAHHHDNLRSFTIKPEKPFTQDAIDRFLACCRSGVFGGLYRVKGIVMTEAHPVLLNIAMRDVSLEKHKGISEPTLTFIGQMVNEKAIVNYFELWPERICPL